MTVQELMSVLSEMDPTDLIVVGYLPQHSADVDYLTVPAGDSVYKAIVDVDGTPHNAVIIDARDAA